MVRQDHSQDLQVILLLILATIHRRRLYLYFLLFLHLRYIFRVIKSFLPFVSFPFVLLFFRYRTHICVLSRKKQYGALKRIHANVQLLLSQSHHTTQRMLNVVQVVSKNITP